jgi:hypothetical protein
MVWPVDVDVGAKLANEMVGIAARELKEATCDAGIQEANTEGC